MASAVGNQCCMGKDEFCIFEATLRALTVNGEDEDDAVESRAGSSGNASKGYADLSKPAIEIRKLFVGNLDKRLTGVALAEFFGAFGRVQNAHFARRSDGMKESYGFVTFYDPEDADKALEAGRHGMRINGRPLVVNKAALRHQPKRKANGKIQWHWKPLWNNRQPKGPGDGSLAKRKPFENIDESKCVIRLLNDDCLMHIFSFLSKRELIKIEKVSKHWKECSMQMWRSTKHLSFEWLSPNQGSPTLLLTNHILKQVTERCGPNIQSLDLSYKPSALDRSALKIVAGNCPNLQCLNFSYFNFHNNLGFLHTITKHLQRVVFNNCSLNDKDLEIFFRHCPELTSVSLADNSNLSGICLEGLGSATLEELTIDNCYGMRDQKIVDSFSRLKCLKRLSMNGCLYLKNSMIEDIFKSIPQVESLSMNHRFPLLHYSGLTALSHLSGLVSLTLHLNAAVNDEVLRAISKNCRKIESLDISGCSVLGHTVEVTVTDNGIVHVAQMPKLTSLKMSYMAILSNQALESLAEKGRLKVVECRGCPTFTDFGCARLISLCNELEHFDISGCNYASMDTVIAANASVKLRTNNVSLTLVVGGTAIDDDCLPDDMDPLLHVDFSDLCVDRHRPDFVDEVYFLAGDDGEQDTDDDFDFELDDDDDISDFDMECQAMFIGDDIGEWFKFHAQGGYESSDSELDEDIFGPYYAK